MQMGFNNDVDYKGLVVHIQTEDHGLKSKKITSQVFHGGAILESKTVSYEKDIAAFTDDESRDDRIRLMMKALHRKFYKRIHEGLYDESLPIGEVRVSADHLTVKDDDDPVALDTPGELLAGEGFSVAGAQADMAAEYAKKSRGEHLEVSELEPGQLQRVTEDMAAAAAQMDSAGFVPLGGVGATADAAASLDTAADVPISTPAPARAPARKIAAVVPDTEEGELLYGATTAFRGLDLPADDLGGVILEAVYAQ